MRDQRRENLMHELLPRPTKTEIKKVAVVSGNRKQFLNYVQEQGAWKSGFHFKNFDREFHYINCRIDLRGYQFDELKRVGTWYQLNDLDEIELQLKAQRLLK